MRPLLTGDPKLLTHGVDQYGFVCGSKNTYNGTVVDLTEQKYLYYLDPFSLLNTSNLPWAASICVSECPSVEDLCEVTSLPCRNSTQYRCVRQTQSCNIFNLTAPAKHKLHARYQETCCEPVVNMVHNSVSFCFAGVHTTL